MAFAGGPTKDCQIVGDGERLIVIINGNGFIFNQPVLMSYAMRQEVKNHNLISSIGEGRENSIFKDLKGQMRYSADFNIEALGGIDCKMAGDLKLGVDLFNSTTVNELLDIVGNKIDARG